MNCPSCFSVMYSKKNVDEISTGFYRMRLHCWNEECEARKFGYQSHMSVLFRPGEKWTCDQYHLPFRHKEKWFALVGEPFQGYLGFPAVQYSLLGNMVKTAPPEKQSTIYQIIQKRTQNTWTFTHAGSFISIPLVDENEETVTVPFVSLSTDDDMHEKAQHLFHRLIKLVVFS